MLMLLALLGSPGSAIADEDCSVPMTDWQPRVAVQRMAEKQGWTVRRIKIDDGCYEIDGLDAQGRTVEATVDPATLTIISLEYEDDDRSKAGTQAPGAPGNGVTGPGGKPKTRQD
jgi:hypothetical protein